MPKVPRSPPAQGSPIDLVDLRDMKLYGYSRQSTVEGKKQREKWLEEELKRSLGAQEETK